MHGDVKRHPYTKSRTHCTQIKALRTSLWEGYLVCLFGEFRNNNKSKLTVSYGSPYLWWWTSVSSLEGLRPRNRYHHFHLLWCSETMCTSPAWSETLLGMKGLLLGDLSANKKQIIWKWIITKIWQKHLPIFLNQNPQVDAYGATDVSISWSPLGSTFEKENKFSVAARGDKHSIPRDWTIKQLKTTGVVYMWKDNWFLSCEDLIHSHCPYAKTCSTK